MTASCCWGTCKGAAYARNLSLGLGNGKSFRLKESCAQRFWGRKEQIKFRKLEVQHGKIRELGENWQVVNYIPKNYIPYLFLHLNLWHKVPVLGSLNLSKVKVCRYFSYLEFWALVLGKRKITRIQEYQFFSFKNSKN